MACRIGAPLRVGVAAPPSRLHACASAASEGCAARRTLQRPRPQPLPQPPAQRMVLGLPRTLSTHSRVAAAASASKKGFGGAGSNGSSGASAGARGGAAAADTPAVPLADAATQSFLSWASGAAGIKCSALAPAMFGTLRGMAASGCIQQDDVLVSVPRSSSIVLAPRARCPFPDAIKKEYWDTAPWFVKMALLLLHQKRLGSGAPLSGYLESLPKRIDLPVMWDDMQLQMLQYAVLVHKVLEQRTEWEAIHARLLAEGVVPGGPWSAPGALTRDDLFWAMAAVRSRTFTGPWVGSSLRDRGRLATIIGFLALTNITFELADVQTTLAAAAGAFLFNILYELSLSRSAKQYAMCPLLDLVNHSSKVESEVSYDYFFDSFSVTASRAYEAGDQVFVNYGQSNDTLMQYYGFAELDNQKDEFTMTSLLKWIEEVAPSDNARLGALNAAGLLPALQLAEVTRGGVPAGTLQSLRYLLAGSAGGPASEAAAPPDAFASPGSVALEATVARVLVHSVTQELASLGTSLEDDVARLQARGVGDIERAALGFRIEKKRILRDCLAALGGGGGGGGGAAQPAESAGMMPAVTAGKQAGGV